jgi:hypothetical protein
MLRTKPEVSLWPVSVTPESPASSRPIAALSILFVAKPGLACLLFGIWLGSAVCIAQDRAPRAYLITPIHSNAVTWTSSFFNGNILFSPTLPISDVTANPRIEIFNYYHICLAAQPTSRIAQAKM